jgi:hypothetical protein
MAKNIRIGNDGTIIREDAAVEQPALSSPAPAGFVLVPAAPTTQAGTTYKVGDTGPAGGIVFYDKGKMGKIFGGWRYLEAAPASSEFKANWNDANKRCASLRVNGIGGWRLPTKYELNLMYRSLKKKGLGGFSDDWFCSSSEDCSFAWYQSFSDGIQHNYYKHHTNSVRAVRAF